MCLSSRVFSKTTPPILMKLCTHSKDILTVVLEQCHQIPFTNKKVACPRQAMQRVYQILLICAYHYECILRLKIHRYLPRWGILKLLPKLVEYLNLYIELFSERLEIDIFLHSASRLGLCNCRYCIYELFEVNICFNLNWLLQLIWNFANR